MMNKILLVVFFLFIASSVYPEKISGFLSENGNPPFRVPKVNSHIDVDARLNEPFWKQALRIHANIEVSPGENIPAPVRTEGLVAYDDSRIFVAIIAYDDHPGEIRAHYVDRDNIWDDDWVLILFDTFNDQRRTYDFACNPLGIQADMIETPTGGGGSWDAIWDSHGRITEDGFIIEMCIPFSSLSFPRSEGEQIWGFDLVRSYPRSVRHHIGSFPRDRNNNCYMCQSEKMIGFADATPGKNIELNPTVASVLSHERKYETSGPFVEKEKQHDPGFTGKWGITPNMIFSTTLNPDFSNIEADVLQLDINNQDVIYYPEKRPFFLEGADFFQTPFNILHTRMMANPNGGVKLTGKEGSNAVGFYTVQDDITHFILPASEGSDTESIDRKSWGSVLRYKRDILKSSNIGFIATDREGKDYYNRVAGIDADIKFTPIDRFQFQVLCTQTQYPAEIQNNYSQTDKNFGGTAYRTYYSHNTRNYELYIRHDVIGKDFRADMGYMTRANYKYTETAGIYCWQQAPGYWYTSISVYHSFDNIRDIDGNLIHRAFTQRWNYEGPMNSHAHTYFEMGKDRYNDKEFTKNWGDACFGFRPVPSLFVHIYLRYGDNIDYENTRKAISYKVIPSFDLNLGKHFKIEGIHTLEKLNVNAGRLYTANISYLKLIYQFNKRIFLRSVFQYVDYKCNSDLYLEEVEPETRELFSQLLLSYKINPKTVFFLGYSDDHYGDRNINLTKTNRTFFAKLGYAFSL